MKKNFKVLSSLALAGMLTTSVMGTSLAATKDVTSNVSGIYDKLITNADVKNVLPIILANSNDIATIRDIKESGLFKTAALEGLNEDKQLRSGDTFKVNGKEYTVVIFGDVDKNGTINVLDALEIAKYVKTLPSKLDGDAIATEMANVKRADQSGVNILDALRIQRFVLGQQADGIIDEIPPQEEKESNYTLVTTDDYINNQNNSNFTYVVEAANRLSEDQSLTLRVKGTASGVATTLPDEAITIKKNEISTSTAVGSIKSINLSTMDEGTTVTLELYEGATIADDAKPVDTCIVEVHKQEPVAAKVCATRDNTREASISLENVVGKAEIAKIHYTIIPDDGVTSAPTNVAELTETLQVKGNSNLKLTDKLEVEGQAYKVYYQLVDVYGNVTTTPSAILGPVIIAASSSVPSAEPVTEIKVPDLKTSTTFTISTNGATDTVIVDLYKDGKLILENEETAVANSVSYDFKAKMAGATPALNYEVGTYSIKVATKEATDGTNKRSEEKASEEVTVKALNSVKNITSKYVEGNPAKIEVSWTDDNTASEEDTTTPYEVFLQKYDETTKKYANVRAVAEATVDKTNKKMVFTIDTTDADSKMVANELYKVKITTKAVAAQNAIINSPAVESPAFYAINVGNVTASDITDQSVTLNLAKEVKVAGKAITKYKVDIYPYTTQMGTLNKPVEVRGTTITKDVELVDGKIVVDGLQPDTRYEFKLFADVDGVIGESGLISKAGSADIRTLKTTPTITNCKIVATEKEANNNTIYFPVADANNTNPVWINGTTKIANYKQGYSQDFQKMMDIIKTSLKVNDVVSISADGISLKLDEATTDAINFAANASGMKLVIEGNVKKERTVTSTTAGKLKEVVVQGKNTIINTNSLFAEKITLCDGVEVRNASSLQTYTIAKNATVIINGVSVTAGAEDLILSAKGKTLTVKVDKLNSNLAFENLNDSRFTTFGDDVVITLEGKDNASVYAGTITINSLGGTVKVSQTKSLDTSKVDLNVNVKDAEVTVNKDFTNKVNMTVTVDTENVASKSELIVTPNVGMPKIAGGVSMDGLEIKNYKDKATLQAALSPLNSGSAITLTDIEYTNIMNFLNSFGMIEKGITGATVETGATAGTVKITFNKSVSNLGVVGLK